MNVASVLVSEFAKVSDGALTIVATVWEAEAAGFPALFPNFYLTIVVHGHSSEANTHHTIEIDFLNHRRERVQGEPHRESFVMPPGPAKSGFPLRSVMVVQMSGLIFPEPGPYAFEIFIDGIYSGATQIYISLQETRE